MTKEWERCHSKKVEQLEAQASVSKKLYNDLVEDNVKAREVVSNTNSQLRDIQTRQIG